MKGIFIDSKNKKVSLVDIENELEAIYKLLGCELICAPFQYGNLDTLYVDDEALLKPLDTIPGVFQFSDYTFQPLFGNALLLGTDEEGGACDVVSSLEEIESKVRFLPDEEACLVFLKYQVHGH